MRSDCQLWVLNAEVTASPRIAPPPCPHSSFPVLVLFFGTTGRAAFEGVLLFSFSDPSFLRTGWSSAKPHSSLGPSLFILACFQIFRPHNNPSISYCPAPRTKRRVLMFLGPLISLSSLALRWCQGLFICLRHVSGASVYTACLH